MNEIGVIIVDYRSDPLLERSLKALSSCDTDIKLKVVVVENSPATLSQKAPENMDIQFLRQEVNLGFGRAVNLAQQKLQTPYFLLLNPDVQLLPNTLSALYGLMEKEKKVGLVVPKLLNQDGRIQFSARRFYDLSTILFRRTLLGNIFPNHPVLRRHLMADWDHATIREIDWALGACMLIRAEAVEREIFDPRFFLYFEDVDLCLRLKKKGWKVMYHPGACAIHEHRQESRKRLFSRGYYEHFVSWMKFIIKYRGLSGVR